MLYVFALPSNTFAHALALSYAAAYIREHEPTATKPRLLNRQHGINPTVLAKATGVQQPTIHRILKGESDDPRTATLQPLADYFGVTVEFLRTADAEAFDHGKTPERTEVEPDTTPNPGDDVVVICHDGRKMVKELLYTRDGEVTLGSINNGFKPISLQLADIQSIHYVAAIVPRGAFYKPT